MRVNGRCGDAAECGRASAGCGDAQRDDDEEEQARQAELEEERKRAAAAKKAAAEHGMDPKTKRQIKYCAGKLAGWLELHGEAAGYDDSVGPTVEVMKD